MARVFWFRRDLRLNDNPALNKAILGSVTDGDSKVAAAYALDLDYFHGLSGIRQNSLNASLNALGESLGRMLAIRHASVESGVSIAQALVTVAQSAEAKIVHASRAFDPAGIAEQNSVGSALAETTTPDLVTGPWPPRFGRRD